MVRLSSRAAFAGFAFSVVTVVLASAAPATAQDARQPPPHVRPERGVQRLVDEAARRSPAIRELMDRLEHLDVTIYIRGRSRKSISKAASRWHQPARATAIWSSSWPADARSSRRWPRSGHELFHAVEIAEEPSVVNATTPAAFDGRIGRQTGEIDGKRTFESQGAAAAGQQVWRELRTANTRNSNGT